MEHAIRQARTLTDKQFKVVHAHCTTRHHAARDGAIVMVSFPVDLRAKEIAALKTRDVLADDGSIRDEFLLAKIQTKRGKTRRVFVRAKLKQELGIYLKQHTALKGFPKHDRPK